MENRERVVPPNPLWGEVKRPDSRLIMIPAKELLVGDVMFGDFGRTVSGLVNWWGEEVGYEVVAVNEYNHPSVIKRKGGGVAPGLTKGATHFMILPRPVGYGELEENEFGIVCP